MAYDDDPSKVSNLPYSLTQNPAPLDPSGQEFLTDREELAALIMNSFREVLPSNYVSKSTGPWYTIQFAAMAQELADLQITIGESYKDSIWDFTRSDLLWQMLGTFVFPASNDQTGIPQIEGDVPYRTFLKKMVLLLLEGATKLSMEDGLEALDPDVTATVLERYLESPPRDPSGAYTIEDQFIVDIFIEGSGSNFPVDPFTLAVNSQLVLAALKPAHVLYQYSYLFRDAFGVVADDTGGFSLDLSQYHYDDLRKWCLGAKEISGVGDTLASRSLFTDPDVSFHSIQKGSKLRILSGANKGVYRVRSKQAFPSGADPVGRPYTTSTGASGTLLVRGGDWAQDTAQDWGLFAEGTKITISTGPNAGTYRLSTVLGPKGGRVGSFSGASSNRTEVRISLSTLKVEKFMLAEATSQPYEVVVDRLGVQVPHTITGEDVSLQFVL